MMEIIFMEMFYSFFPPVHYSGDIESNFFIVFSLLESFCRQIAEYMSLLEVSVLIQNRNIPALIP